MAENHSWRSPGKDLHSSEESDDEGIVKYKSKPTESKDHRKDDEKPCFQPVWQPKPKPGNGRYNHPCYKNISKGNNLVNRMDVDEISRKLAECGINSRGAYEVVSKRLKNWIKTRELREAKMEMPKNDIDFIVVIDFEATCEESNPPNFIQEIIEFPAVLVDVERKEIVTEFHSYCRPVINKMLTKFCIDLTGITQIMVDSAPRFATVLRRFDEWIKVIIKPGTTFAVLTDGPWDISKFLNTQCKKSRVEMPYYFNTWINIRKHFRNYYKVNKTNLEGMLNQLGMHFQGRPHSGIDDTRNIARIAMQLLEDGCDLKINETFG